VSSRASVVCVAALVCACGARQAPIPPVDKLPFESLAFRRLADRDGKGWPKFEIANLGKRRVTAIDVVVYAYVIAEVTDGMREVYPLVYVARAAPGAWHVKANASWPEGVGFDSLDTSRIEALKRTNGAITYVEWPIAVAFALPVATLENHAGEWRAPTSATTTAAGADARVDGRLFFDPVASDDPAAYPIVYASWAVVDGNAHDAMKLRSIRAYLEFLLGPGQKLIEEGNYGRLSPAVVERALAAVRANLAAP
jgi:hypothetical protein